MSAPSAPPASGGPAGGGLSTYQQYVADNELSAEVASDLASVLNTTRIVLLLDDSGSMKTRVVAPGQSAMAAGPAVTRWSELERLAATIVEMVNACTGGGVDAHFLNRPSVLDVHTRMALAPAFAALPSGGTPLLRCIKALTDAYAGDLAAGRRVLIIVITDGEPSDGSPDDLFRVLSGILRSNTNLYMSFAECNDNEEEMAYLDGWDTRLPRFDNSDDYGMEAGRVKAAQASRGLRVRFTYADYVIKIMLGAVLRKYFNLDQSLGTRGMAPSTYGGPAYAPAPSYTPAPSFNASGPAYGSSAPAYPPYGGAAPQTAYGGAAYPPPRYTPGPSGTTIIQNDGGCCTIM